MNCNNGKSELFIDTNQNALLTPLKETETTNIIGPWKLFISIQEDLLYYNQQLQDQQIE